MFKVAFVNTVKLDLLKSFPNAYLVSSGYWAKSSATSV